VSYRFSPTMLGLSIGVEDVHDDAFEPKVRQPRPPCRVHMMVTDLPSPHQISLSVSVAKAQCSLFNQLTLVDRQEDFGAVHFEDAMVRLAKWDDGQLVRVRLAFVTRWWSCSLQLSTASQCARQGVGRRSQLPRSDAATPDRALPA
jgi:hypothetical protein